MHFSKLAAVLPLILVACQDSRLFDFDGDGVVDEDDCAPADPEIYPGAGESGDLCGDNLDNDCDGKIDDEDEECGGGACIDQDNDGYCAELDDCDDHDPGANGDDADGDGWSTCAGDCDDDDDTLHPGADEICDGVDNDCDPGTDELADADGDGWSGCDGDCDDSDAALTPGDLDGDGWSSCDGDCVDSDEFTNPGAVEICNGADDDCDPFTDEQVDIDGDGQAACEGDCDETDPTTFDGADEVCDLLDNDCDGVSDEGLNWDDDDGDGWSLCDGDCDDSDAIRYPTAVEQCDGVDNDCDEVTPLDEVDGDLDGFMICAGDCDDGDAGVHPEAFDVCSNGLDDDCDGQTDLDCVVCDLDVPGDQTTVQAAIMVAPEGYGICVAPGTYTENIDFLGKSLVITGVGGEGRTVIHGGNAGPTALFYSGESSTSVLQGFTLTGGGGIDYGGGVRIDGASPTLSRLYVTGNTAILGGGGISVGESDTSATHITDSRIEDNSTGQEGGGLRIYSSNVTLARVRLEGNNGGWGGGLHVSAGSEVQLDDVLCTHNTVTHTGGCLDAHASIIAATNLAVVSNSAAHTGGGIYAIGGCDLTLENVSLLANQISDVSGDGGGLYFDLGSLSFTNGVVAHNTVLDEGGGLWVHDSPELVNVVITGNSAGNGGGALWAELSMASIDSCAVWNNTPNDYGNLSDPTGFDGNLRVDPQFVDIQAADPLDWDLHLALASSLINTGHLDFTDPDISPSDMGLYSGPSGDGWDLDGDEYDEWWQPGSYDYGTYPGIYLDCDDSDPSVFPGQGC